jgi:hypothetical protein
MVSSFKIMKRAITVEGKAHLPYVVYSLSYMYIGKKAGLINDHVYKLSPIERRLIHSLHRFRRRI